CADPPIVYKSTNLECLPHPKFVENATCKVKALNWNKAVLHMDCDLIKPLRNPTVRVQLFKKNYSNQYHPFLINVVFNLCDIISKRNFIPYGKIVWNVLKQHSNVNHSCPFAGHLMARNLYIDANNSIIPIFPLGFYLLSMDVVENYGEDKSEPAGIIKYYIQVAEMVKIKQKANR
ncbi:hypothetical protein KR222_007454, partial [Zaprionus bogoriensis]